MTDAERKIGLLVYLRNRGAHVESAALPAWLGIAAADAPAALEALCRESVVAREGGALFLAPDADARLREWIAHELAEDAAELPRFFEAFRPFDRRVKEIATAWQTREVGGSAMHNDHRDPEYDSRIIDRLEREVHEPFRRAHEAAPSGVRRMTAPYVARLETALERIEDGDTRYVTGVDVDSYHGAWFELHELLLTALGKTRDE